MTEAIGSDLIGTGERGDRIRPDLDGFEGRSDPELLGLVKGVVGPGVTRTGEIGDRIRSDSDWPEGRSDPACLGLVGRAIGSCLIAPLTSSNQDSSDRHSDKYK